MKTIDLFNNNHKPYATPRVKVFQMDVEELMQGQGGATGSTPDQEADGEWEAAKRVKKIIVEEPEEEEAAKGPFPYL